MSIVRAETRFTTITLASVTAGPFDIGFPMHETTGVNVYLNGEPVGFTVSSAAVSGTPDPAATVTLDAAGAIGDVIWIVGDILADRPDTFLPSQENLVAAIEATVTKHSVALLEAKRDGARSFRTTFNLPPIAPSANAILAFNADGTGFDTSVSIPDMQVVLDAEQSAINNAAAAAASEAAAAISAGTADSDANTASVSAAAASISESNAAADAAQTALDAAAAAASESAAAISAATAGDQIFNLTVTGATTANDIVATTPSGDPPALLAGMTFMFRASFDNTGAMTLKVNSFAAVTMNSAKNNALRVGEISESQRYLAVLETPTRALLVDIDNDMLDRLDQIEATQAADNDATNAELSILTPYQGVDPDAAAWLAAVPGSVTPSIQSLVVSTVFQLKQTGIWSALDVINMDLGVSEQAALINLKDPSNIHTNNGAVYVRGQGFKGNGVDAWIDTGLDVTTLAGYSQSDAHLSAWETEDITSDARSIATSGAISAYIAGRLTGGSFSARINDATADAVAVDTSLGLSGANRSGASARELYRNGLLVASDAQASTSIVGVGNLSVLRSNILYSERRVWAYTAGSSLTAAQWGSLFAILNNVRDKVVDSISLAPTEARLTKQTVPVVTNAITASMDDGHAVEVLLDANVTTVTVTDWPQSVAQVRFYFTQDATGGRTVTFPVGWIGDPAPAPATSANSRTSIIAESLDGGATVYLMQGETWNG